MTTPSICVQALPCWCPLWSLWQPFAVEYNSSFQGLPLCNCQVVTISVIISWRIQLELSWRWNSSLSGQWVRQNIFCVQIERGVCIKYSILGINMVFYSQADYLKHRLEAFKDVTPEDSAQLWHGFLQGEPTIQYHSILSLSPNLPSLCLMCPFWSLILVSPYPDQYNEFWGVNKKFMLNSRSVSEPFKNIPFCIYRVSIATQSESTVNCWSHS